MTTDGAPPHFADERVETPTADDAYLAALRRLTPAQKLAVVQGPRPTAWKSKAAAVRARHPEWLEGQVQARVRDVFLRAGGGYITYVPTDRGFVRVRRLTLHDVSQDSAASEADVAARTPAERVDMMWQLARDAWAFMGEPVAEPRLPRGPVRVRRRAR